MHHQIEEKERHFNPSDYSLTLRMKQVLEVVDCSETGCQLLQQRSDAIIPLRWKKEVP
jgi:hypothetical protein